MLNFLKDFIYLFLERGERKEKERERNIYQLPFALALRQAGTQPATQVCALTGVEPASSWSAGPRSIH